MCLTYVLKFLKQQRPRAAPPQDIRSGTMHHLIRFIGILLLLGWGPASAQSSLPACPATGYFHNCFGTYTGANGGKYVGEWKDNKRNGQGTFTFPDGAKYVGGLKDDQRNGQGTYTRANGDKYVGGYKDDERNGQGTFTWADGNKYVGEYKNNKFNGQGTFTFPDGAKYVGEFKDEKFNGQGTLTFPDGAVISAGIWADGQFVRSAPVQQQPSNTLNIELAKHRAEAEEVKRRQAQAEEQLRLAQQAALQREEKFWDDAKAIGNKEAFEGYVASHPSGRYVSLANASIQRLSQSKSSPPQDAAASECLGNPESWNLCIGTQTLNSGVKYVGEFKGGKRNGQGTLTWPNGQKYVGEFKDNTRRGQGALSWPTGQKYVGEFKENKISGQGTFTWPDGQKYVGEFSDGKRSGQGTNTNPDGTKYVGEWKDDKANGQGTRNWLDGAKYVGEWVDDKRSGQGTFSWPDGSKYVGEFRDSKVNGQGIRTWPDGAKYVGQFVDEKRHGQGSMMRPDGSLMYSGLWTDGKQNSTRPAVQQRTFTPMESALEARCRGYGFESQSAGIAQCMLQLDQAERQSAQLQSQRRELESRCEMARAQGYGAPTMTGGWSESLQNGTNAYSACMAGLPPPRSNQVICRREGRDEFYCFNQ